MSELTTLFTNIANAIRSKTGDTSAIPATNFSSAINDIAVAQIKEVTTSGGSTSITVPGINGKSFMFTATAQKEGNGMLLYGYSSGNACLTANDILKYIYNLADEDTILTGYASSDTSNTSND